MIKRADLSEKQENVFELKEKINTFLELIEKLAYLGYFTLQNNPSLRIGQNFLQGGAQELENSQSCNFCSLQDYFFQMLTLLLKIRDSGAEEKILGIAEYVADQEEIEKETLLKLFKILISAKTYQKKIPKYLKENFFILLSKLLIKLYITPTFWASWASK